MSQVIPCNCYINGIRKPKADRATCTDVRRHIANKQVADHYGMAEESSEDEKTEEDEKKDEKKDDKQCKS